MAEDGGRALSNPIPGVDFPRVYESPYSPYGAAAGPQGRSDYVTAVIDNFGNARAEVHLRNNDLNRLHLLLLARERKLTDAKRARWQALAAFHAKHGHFLVTNGPYTVKSWSADAAVLEVVRDPRYPLGVGSYDSYAIPRRAFVAKAETSADGIVLAVEVETVETVARDYRIVRQPLKGGATGAGKRLIPECRYVVVSGDGRVALAGQGHLRDDGTFALDLRGKLAPGRYTVLAALYVNGNAMNAEIKRIPYEVP